MKVTVITVCLNVRDTIREALESLAAQDYPQLEYIVVDGASTDGTLDIIREYRQHIDTLVSEPDRGMYDSANKGLRLATGDVVDIPLGCREVRSVGWALCRLLPCRPGTVIATQSDYYLLRRSRPSGWCRILKNVPFHPGGHDPYDPCQLRIAYQTDARGTGPGATLCRA